MYIVYLSKKQQFCTGHHKAGILLLPFTLVQFFSSDILCFSFTFLMVQDHPCKFLQSEIIIR